MSDSTKTQTSDTKKTAMAVGAGVVGVGALGWFFLGGGRGGDKTIITDPIIQDRSTIDYNLNQTLTTDTLNLAPGTPPCTSVAILWDDYKMKYGHWYKGLSDLIIAYASSSSECAEAASIWLKTQPAAECVRQRCFERRNFWGRVRRPPYHERCYCDVYGWNQDQIDASTLREQECYDLYKLMIDDVYAMKPKMDLNAEETLCLGNRLVGFFDSERKLLDTAVDPNGDPVDLSHLK